MAEVPEPPWAVAGARARGLRRRFGLIVPCRNEAAVIGRKLANLARESWASERGPARLVVVDDHSTDDTAARARAALPGLAAAGLEALVLESRGAPGKARAVAQALAALGDTVDLVLLTDADVVFAPGVPAALERAFADPRVGLVCGAQRFVRDLASDGSARGADGAALLPRGDLYDRATTLVRRLESRVGRLFSVHGQCLCWRAELELAPTPAIAADDLDLMLQARARGVRVQWVEGAVFLEPKVPRGPQREAQAVRRAAAYFQVLRRTPWPLRGGALDRLQWWSYRYLPTLLPELALLAESTLLALALRLGGPAAALALLLAQGLLALVPSCRQLLRYPLWIWRARRGERQQSLTDSWEMVR
jgi:cellulose synthase/poly-beta-1,6-N-acetylglucosamine synthase-like glycosyltransferase